MNNKILGLDQDVYDKLATNHSKTNIWLWVIGGLVYNYFWSDLSILWCILIVFPGIFIASFASMPTFWLSVKKMQIAEKHNNLFVVIGLNILGIFDLAYPVLISILYVEFIGYLLRMF